MDGFRIGDEAVCDGPSTIAPDDSWIGRVIDPTGAALDNKPIYRGGAQRALVPPPVNPAERRGLGARLETGLAVFDTMLPIVRGQRIGLFAGRAWASRRCWRGSRTGSRPTSSWSP